MGTKNESVLGLAPLRAPPTLQISGWKEEPGVGRAVSKREQTILGLHHEQTLVIDAIGCKTRFGMATIGDIQRHAATEFADIAAWIYDLKGDTQGKGYQAPVEEFSLCLIQVSARHLLGVVEVSDASIGGVIRAPLEPPPQAPPPPPKPGILARLLGK
jgi:hypothetical protein